MWKAVKMVLFLIIAGYVVHFFWVNGWDLGIAKMGLEDPNADFVKAQKLVVQHKVDSALPLLEYENARGNLAARELLATLYEHGEGVPKDSQRAFDLFKDLSANGDPDPYAENEIGIMYFCGQLGPPDQNLAREWFAKAAKHHYQRALSYEAKIDAHDQMKCENAN
jgi:TPR repeat protein